MNNLSKEHAEKLAKINAFVDNWKAKHGNTDLLDGHSVYLLRTEDRDGNITGEAFALNVTTWRYYRSYFGPSSGRPYSDTYIRYLYIGDGTHDEYGDFPTTRSSMFHQTYTASATGTSDDQTRIEGGTVYYDQDTGLLRGQSWVYTGYFDYVLSGISSDLTVTEVGLSAYNSNGELATHAYVMDNEGNYTSFVKHVNEKLTIDAYITVYHKPGYIENKLWNQGVGFAYNPWAWYAFGRQGAAYNWNSHYNGNINYFTSSIISSPRWNRDSTSRDYSSNTTYRAGFICGAYASVGDVDSSDSETQISTRSWSHSGTNSLIENKGYFYDLLWLSGFNSYGTPSSGENRYAAQVGVIKEMRLPEPEEIVTNYAYTGTINNDDLSANFGHYQNAAYDTRGLLPVTNMNVSSVKSYNGLTKEWDIDEVVLNGTNTTNLTMNQLYPICGIYMNCQYLDTNVIRWGRQFVRVYPNMYTSFPISKISTTNISSTNIWCSDQYWNPYSWERVEDPNNVPASQGAKRYFMGFGGEITGNSGPNTNTRPVEVTRTGYTKPALVSEDTIRIDSIDTFNNGRNGYAEYNGYPYVCSNYGYGHTKILSDDNMGYIWMRYHLYYPDDSDLSSPGQSWLIQTSEPVGGMCSPYGSLRFKEPSGHRILQVFQSNAVNGFPSVCLQKVSVFEIHSAAEVAQDPSKVAPDEYVINMGNTFLNSYNYDSSGSPFISSTETGYVVFGNTNDSRTHIVNMLGDAESNYEPYKFILKYPDTDEEVPVSTCFAMKYTNKVVFRDPRQDTDVLIGWMILDLSTNTVVDTFTIERTSWGGTFIWGGGWYDYFYMFGRTSDSTWDSNTQWKCRIYDGTRPAGSRIIDPEWSSEVCRCFIPGVHHWNWNRHCWHRMHMGTLQGDEEAIFFGRNNVSGDNTAVLLYSISRERPLEPFGFNNVGIVGKFQRSLLVDDISAFDVFKTPDGKQRLLVFHINDYSFYSNSDYIYYQYKTWVFDANLIRDMRSGPGRINSNPSSIPALINRASSNSYENRWRYFGMYKGRILISEYDNTYSQSNVGGWKYYMYTRNYHRFVDPKRLLPHKMTGTTYTIQAYNNPKRIYGIQNFTFKLINNAEIWDPSDMPVGE